MVYFEQKKTYRNVLVNPRYLNCNDGDDDDDNDDDDEDEVISNPHRPSPTSQTYSSSNASSIRSLDIDIETKKKNEKTLCLRSNKTPSTNIIRQDKVCIFLNNNLYLMR